MSIREGKKTVSYDDTYQQNASPREERKQFIQNDIKKRKPITPSWRHYKLKEYFAQHAEASITLTFQDIEAIEKRPLPSSARKDRHFWYHRKTENGIAEAWRTEGYSLKRLDMGKEKITLHRDAVGASKLVIPAVLMNGKLPDNAVYELERHMEYIINKYGLIE